MPCTPLWPWQNRSAASRAYSRPLPNRRRTLPSGRRTDKPWHFSVNSIAPPGAKARSQGPRRPDMISVVCSAGTPAAAVDVFWAVAGRAATAASNSIRRPTWARTGAGALREQVNMGDVFKCFMGSHRKLENEKEIPPHEAKYGTRLGQGSASMLVWLQLRRPSFRPPREPMWLNNPPGEAPFGLGTFTKPGQNLCPLARGEKVKRRNLTPRS